MKILSIIVPVYNEAQTLQSLIGAVENIPLPQFEKEIILVDAGSTDSSQTIIMSYKDRPGFKICALQFRGGKGRAVREGLRLASGDIFLIQDGDLEYSPEDYPVLLQHFLNEQVDFVIGSRTLSAGTWRLRSSRRPLLSMLTLDFGGLLLTTLFCWLYGVKISDPLSMFKIFKRNQLDIFALKSEGFEIDWEILCRLVKKNFRFIEVPVRYSPRTKKEGKKLTAWKEGLKSVRIILAENSLSEVPAPYTIRTSVSE